jgi:hypothetical protein
VTDYHVITPEAEELVIQVINGQVVIVPPAPIDEQKLAPEFTEIQR